MCGAGCWANGLIVGGNSGGRAVHRLGREKSRGPVAFVMDTPGGSDVAGTLKREVG